MVEVRWVETRGDFAVELVLWVWEGSTEGMAHSYKDFDDLLRNRLELVLLFSTRGQAAGWVAQKPIRWSTHLAYAVGSLAAVAAASPQPASYLLHHPPYLRHPCSSPLPSVVHTVVVAGTVDAAVVGSLHMDSGRIAAGAEKAPVLGTLAHRRHADSAVGGKQAGCCSRIGNSS